MVHYGPGRMCSEISQAILDVGNPLNMPCELAYATAQPGEQKPKIDLVNNCYFSARYAPMRLLHNPRAANRKLQPATQTTAGNYSTIIITAAAPATAATAAVTADFLARLCGSCSRARRAKVIDTLPYIYIDEAAAAAAAAVYDYV